MSRLKSVEKVPIVTLLMLFIYIALSSANNVLASNHSDHMIESNIQWATVIENTKIMLEIAAVLIASSILITKLYLAKISNEHNTKIIKIERLTLLIMLCILVFLNSNADEIPYKLLIAIIWNIVSWFNNFSVLSSSIKYISSISLLSIICLEQINEYTFYGVCYAATTLISKFAIVVWLSILITHYLIIINNRNSEEQWHLSSIKTLSKIANLYLLFVSVACIIQIIFFRESIDTIYIYISYLYLLITISLYFILRKGVKKYFENHILYVLQQHLRLVLNISIISLLFIIFIPLSVNAKPVMLKEPVFWHVMGDDSHMSLRVSQMIKKRDMQNVQLDLWLPSHIGEPSSVNLIFKFADTSVEIPLQLEASGPDPYGFEGFDKYTYQAIGNFVIEYGELYATINATDQTGKIYMYEKEIVQ